MHMGSGQTVMTQENEALNEDLMDFLRQSTGSFIVRTEGSNE